jgi:hypothetical protein
LLTGAAEVALTTIKSAITTLPDLSDPTFTDRAGTLLADLRRLETVAASAAQSTKGAPDITLTLGAVRRCYRELMLRAARAWGHARSAVVRSPTASRVERGRDG